MRKRIIWTNTDNYESWKHEMLEEGYSEEETTLEAFYESIENWFDDELANLNNDLDKVVVCFATLGLWDGKHRGAKICGNNVHDFLHSAVGDCNYTFYCDQYNVRADASHHDGNNTMLYRLCKNKDEAERIMAQWVYEDAPEEKVRKKTRSLRPYVARVYDW